MPVRPPDDSQLKTALVVGGSDANEGLYGMDVPEDAEEDLELPDIEEIPVAVHSSEAHVAKVKPVPTRHNSEEVAAHDATHCPFCSWCPVCAEATSKEDLHPRSSGKDAETGLPVVLLDYELIEEKITVLIANGRETGAALAHECATKGPEDDWVVRRLMES